MRPSTKDQIAGSLDELKGKVKAKAGDLVGNPRLQTEGRVQNLSGKMQQKVGQIKRVFEP